MSVVEWFSLALVCLLGAATPGPSLAIIINHSLRHGINGGRLASVSHAFAIGLYALAAVLGLATLFEQLPVVADVFVYAGAAYLAYLGVKLLRASFSEHTSKQKDENNNANDGVKQAFLIAFLNPKIAVFFLALFSQFIPTTGASLSLTSILVGTVLFIDMFWYLAVVQIVEKLKHKVSTSGAAVKRLLLAQGVIFILLAINAVLVNHQIYQV